MAKLLSFEKIPDAKVSSDRARANYILAFFNWILYDFLPVIVMLTLTSWLTLVAGNWIDENKVNQPLNDDSSLEIFQ